MKVEQYQNKNQFHIYGNDEDILQSYNSTVVIIKHYNEDNANIHLITLGCDWDYSKTTSKHVYMFLEEYGNIYIPYNEKNKRKYIQSLIDSGEIDYNEELR